MAICSSGTDYLSMFIRSGDQPAQGAGLVSGHQADEVGACTGLGEGLRSSWKLGSPDWKWGRGPCSEGKGFARSTGLHTPHPMAKPGAFLSAFGCRTKHAPPAKYSMCYSNANK